VLAKGDAMFPINVNRAAEDIGGLKRPLSPIL
jgi:hypothetical protein